MIIDEGILALTKFQYRQVLYFISKIKIVANKLLFSNSNNPSSDYTVKVLNMAAAKIQHNMYHMLPIRFVFLPDLNTEGTYNHPQLNMNLFYLSKNNGKDTIELIWWNKVQTTIIHEWIHHKQAIRMPSVATDRWLDNTHNINKILSKSDQEHMPLAATEVEDLRNLLRTVDPTRIIAQLKKMGVTKNSLNNLKISNPKAWKRIMKNAVMYALHAPGEV